MHVLGFDRLTPAPHHVEEVALETRHPASHVGELVARTQLREAGMRPVERLQRLAVATQSAEQFRELAVGLALERQVVCRRRHATRRREVRLRSGQVVGLARDDAVDLFRLAVGARVVEVLRERHRTVTPSLGLVEVPLLDLQCRAVHFERDTERQAAEGVGDRQRLGERLVRRVQAPQRHVRHAEVVQRDDDVVEQRVQAAVRQRVLVIAERFPEVAANARQRSQVRHHVHLQARIGGARPALERLVEQLLRVIQVALPPAHGGEDVQGMAERIALVAQLRGGDRGDRAVFGRAVVGVHLVRARDPSKQHGRQRRRRGLQAAQCQFVECAGLRSPSELVERPSLVDERTRRRMLRRCVHEPQVRRARGVIGRGGHGVVALTGKVRFLLNKDEGRSRKLRGRPCLGSPLKRAAGESDYLSSRRRCSRSERPAACCCRAAGRVRRRPG